jgi:imidazolonepropionase-like amidohydrolase
MKFTNWAKYIFLMVVFQAFSIHLQGEESRIVIHAGRLLDGKGGMKSNVFVIVEGSRIISIQEKPLPATFDLSGLTLMPGGIDTHVHISWHFDADGKSHDPEKIEESAHSLPFALENAYRTIMSGITTVQSVGSPADVDLKNWLKRGTLPGPEVLTAIEPITDETKNPEEIRAQVEAVAAKGADVIKIFASKSIRDGGGPTLTQEQLNAACGAAKKAGLRSVIHAHGPESVRRAVIAGCTSIEHGVLLDRETLKFIADHGTYFDPNIGLIFQNYFENKNHFLGIGNYTEEGFRKMEEAVPTALNMFKQALEIKNLKIVFGTDAVAGSHGRNFEELIYRVQKGGQSPMAAIVSATELASQSLRLENTVGTIAPGMQADLIALEGNPLQDITAFRRVLFVMKSGKVYKNLVPSQRAGKMPAVHNAGWKPALQFLHLLNDGPRFVASASGRQPLLHKEGESSSWMLSKKSGRI